MSHDFPRSPTPVVSQPPELEVYQTGELTVVGFGGRDILDQVDLANCRLQIVDLLQQHQAHTLAFDLTGVRLMPSGLLGLLASLRKMNVAVHLYNPSADVQEVLELTRLNQILEIHHLDPTASPPPTAASPPGNTPPGTAGPCTITASSSSPDNNVPTNNPSPERSTQ